MSPLEFLGCFAALVGGIVLGAMYLGLDLKSAALQLLAKTQLIQANPAGPAGPVASAASMALPLGVAGNHESTPDDPATTTTTTTTTTATTTTAPTVSHGEADEEDSVEGFSVRAVLEAELADLQAQQLTEPQRAAFTAQYWKDLCQIIESEHVHRHTPLDQEDEGQLFEFLAHRQRGHQTAVDRIAELDPRGVDLTVLSFSKRMLRWQREGAKLYRHAAALLTSAPATPVSGPIAQSWQSAATQHRMEETLLLEKFAAVKEYLRHQADSRPAAKDTSDQQSTDAHSDGLDAANRE
jgi:hypothetical protein